MSRDDLRSAIETPAKTAGLSFAPPQLVDRILDDVGLEEGRLPLLQFALKETWQKAGGRQAHRRRLHGGRRRRGRDREDGRGRLRTLDAFAEGRGATSLPAARHARRGAGRHPRAQRHSRRP